MQFVQIFNVTVPLVIIYMYQFLVLLRTSKKINAILPVFKVFIAKAIVCLQPVVSRIALCLYLCNKEKPKSCFLELSFLVAWKTLQNLNISCTFYVSTMKLCLSSKLKKIWRKNILIYQRCLLTWTFVSQW